jgi:hypothetical protein
VTILKTTPTIPLYRLLNTLRKSFFDDTQRSLSLERNELSKSDLCNLIEEALYSAAFEVWYLHIQFLNWVTVASTENTHDEEVAKFLSWFNNPLEEVERVLAPIQRNASALTNNTNINSESVNTESR